MEYNIRLEFKLPPDEEHGDELVTALESFHAAAGPAGNGNLDVWITVPANNARQAIDLGLALASSATSAVLTAFEVITTEDFDRREGNTPLPDMIGADEVADILGISRQAVSQKFNRGEIPGRRVGDRVLVFVRADIEAIAADRAGRPHWVVAESADGTVHSWHQLEEEARAAVEAGEGLYTRRVRHTDTGWE